MTENKEYIINIRVSKDVYKKLKERAKENSESLSSLVRKTIDDGFEIFGDLRKELFGDGEEKNGNGKFVHYEKVIVAREMECEHCHKPIAKGDNAFLGETKSGQRKYFCADCFTKK